MHSNRKTRKVYKSNNNERKTSKNVYYKFIVRQKLIQISMKKHLSRWYHFNIAFRPMFKINLIINIRFMNVCNKNAFY